MRVHNYPLYSLTDYTSGMYPYDVCSKVCQYQVSKELNENKPANKSDFRQAILNQCQECFGTSSADEANLLAKQKEIEECTDEAEKKRMEVSVTP